MSDFIDDILEVYEKHGLSISHEDTQGMFIIEDYSKVNVEWLRESLKYQKLLEGWAKDEESGENAGSFERA